MADGEARRHVAAATAGIPGGSSSGGRCEGAAAACGQAQRQVRGRSSCRRAGGRATARMMARAPFVHTGRKMTALSTGTTSGMFCMTCRNTVEAGGREGSRQQVACPVDVAHHTRARPRIPRPPAPSQRCLAAAHRPMDLGQAWHAPREGGSETTSTCGSVGQGRGRGQGGEAGGCGAAAGMGSRGSASASACPPHSLQATPNAHVEIAGQVDKHAGGRLQVVRDVR